MIVVFKSRISLQLYLEEEQVSGIWMLFQNMVQFGLDQNADGKVDISDAMAASTKGGGLGGILRKLFGNKTLKITSLGGFFFLLNSF
jgi:hypothetical protein